MSKLSYYKNIVSARGVYHSLLLTAVILILAKPVFKQNVII